MLRRLLRLLLLIGMLAPPNSVAYGAAAVYYVSSSGGSDGYNGLTPGAAFQTIGKVNALNLQPGDQVLFKCGDTWRGEMLTITKSGAAGQPITFGSYPADCANKPIISGAQPIAGWAVYSGNIYVANLSAGANAGKFTNGVNQLFRGETRLPLGRWPNLNTPDGGYSTIDGTPAGNQISDNQLPAVNWAGAVAHIKGMRWYILNRQVTDRSGIILTLGANSDCWDGNCTGWGYFLNNHLSTLDLDGEWYYDATASRVYLYSTSGAPADNQVEGSVILKTNDRYWGGVTLGQDLTGSGIAYVTIENLNLRRWFRDGIAMPTNFANTEPHDLSLRNNTIQDVDATGIRLMTWVYSATDGRPDGWRGGYNLTVSGNTIERANRMGIDLQSRNSTFSNNTVRDVGRIENLGAAGMGCAYDDGEGQCTEDGTGIRIKIDQPNDSGNYNTFTGNRLERIAHNGFHVFGHHNTFTQNVIIQPCIAKGDCGAMSTFGRDSLAASAVHDLTFNQNIIVDVIGNTDGCHSDYAELFGFGLYIDNYSRDIAITNNTIISATVHGILFQNSTGSATGNTLYNNGRTWPWSGQIYVGGAPAQLSTHTGNILYSLTSNGRTLLLDDPSRLGPSNNNYFFNPYNANHIQANGDRTLSSWRTYSGKDTNSKEHWFTQLSGEPPRSRIFYNDTAQSMTIDLGDRQYLDLDQNPVRGSITLAPFTSKILIDNGPAALTLYSLSHTLVGADEAADFTLTINGDLFTPQSIVRWNGAARPTTFVNSSMLTAAISAADVSIVADIPVTVYDPSPSPTGTVTSSLVIHVVASVSRLYLPTILNGH